jgi:Flp pilus assembly protein TadG
MVMRLLNRWRSDRRGVAAVEFAFIAPILILSYFAVAELSGAMLAGRKAGHEASEVGDLVAQCQTIAASDFTDVWTIGGEVMEPLSTTPLSMRVTSIVANAAGATTVGWSFDNGGALTKYATGATITAPTGLVPASGSVIMSETRYVYTSPVGIVVKSALPFNNTFYLAPRQTTIITLGTACGL